MCGPTEFQRIPRRDGGDLGRSVQQSLDGAVSGSGRLRGRRPLFSHCAQASCPAPVFYAGIDDDSPLKTYSLVDLRADGTALGHITMIFAFSSSVQQGNLDPVTLSADGQHLTMQFWQTWTGHIGPVVLDLKRAP